MRRKLGSLAALDPDSGDRLARGTFDVRKLRDASRPIHETRRGFVRLLIPGYFGKAGRSRYDLVVRTTNALLDSRGHPPG